MLFHIQFQLLRIAFMHFTLPIKSLLKVFLKTVPLFALLKTDYSRPPCGRQNTSFFIDSLSGPSLFRFSDKPDVVLGKPKGDSSCFSVEFPIGILTDVSSLRHDACKMMRSGTSCMKIYH